MVVFVLIVKNIKIYYAIRPNFGTFLEGFFDNFIALILDIRIDKHMWDETITKRFKDVYHNCHKLYDAAQHHGETVVIINDKGHKRKYYHEMFRLVEDIKC